MSWQELFVNSENSPDDDPWEIRDPDHDVNVEWARLILIFIAIIGAGALAVIFGGLIYFGSMVIQWP